MQCEILKFQSMEFTVLQQNSKVLQRLSAPLVLPQRITQNQVLYRKAKVNLATRCHLFEYFFG